MKYSEYSVVVIGSGAAGLYSALKISQQIELPDGILLLTKSSLGESNSMYAQGGIVGVMHDNPEDSVELHIKDTLKAGAGLSEYETIKFISENSDEVINDLINKLRDTLSNVAVEYEEDENSLLPTLENQLSQAQKKLKTFETKRDNIHN